MLGLYVSYNWRTTGDALENGYQASGDLSQSVGFSGCTASRPDSTTPSTTWRLWPPLRMAGRVMSAPGVRPRAVRPGDTPKLDWFFLACALAIISSAAFYTTTGAVKGPRYVYEAVPFLLLLAARGFDIGGAGRARAASPASRPVRRGIPSVIVYATACADRDIAHRVDVRVDTHMEGRRRSCECKRTLRSTPMTG